MISAVPFSGRTSGLIARVIVDSVGASSGVVWEPAAGRSITTAIAAATDARRGGNSSALDFTGPAQDDIGMGLGGQADRLRDARGYAMAALLVAIGVMSVMLTVALPAWRQASKRGKEAELIFRGEQYARAVVLFQRKFAGGFPPSIDLLADQKFLRKKYLDPMVEDGEFQVLYQTSAAAMPVAGAAGVGATPGLSVPPGGTPASEPGQPGTSGAGGSAFDTGEGGVRGGVVGVVSKSEETSLRLYNGRSRYNEWQFLYTAPGATPGPAGVLPGAQLPGAVAPGGGRFGAGQMPGAGRGVGLGRPPTQPPGGGVGSRGGPPR